MNYDRNENFTEEYEPFQTIFLKHQRIQLKEKKLFTLGYLL